MKKFRSIPVLMIDLSDWTRLAEVDAHAKARNIDRGEAIRDLVNEGLSNPPPPPGHFDWLVAQGAEALMSQHAYLTEDYTHAWFLKIARVVLEAPYRCVHGGDPGKCS